MELTIVIPTFNEVKALPQVLRELIQSLNGTKYEIIIVDDGNDASPQVIADMHLKQVQFYRRDPEDRNGLAGAVIFGINKSSGQYIASMDGDGQHPAENVRRMYWKAVQEHLDMVMASRYIVGGSTEGLDGGLRLFYSAFLRQLPRVIFPKLRAVTDPLAGCFLVKASCMHVEYMRAIGFKIALEVLLFSSIEKYGEISYEFLERIGGESKTNFKVGIQYLMQLLSLAKRYYSASIILESRHAEN
jgi:dolichol-phosphate mannosyltransferase